MSSFEKKLKSLHISAGVERGDEIGEISFWFIIKTKDFHPHTARRRERHSECIFLLSFGRRKVFFLWGERIKENIRQWQQNYTSWRWGAAWSGDERKWIKITQFKLEFFRNHQKLFFSLLSCQVFMFYRSSHRHHQLLPCTRVLCARLTLENLFYSTLRHPFIWFYWITFMATMKGKVFPSSALDGGSHHRYASLRQILCIFVSPGAMWSDEDDWL